MQAKSAERHIQQKHRTKIDVPGVFRSMALPISFGSFWPRFFFRASPTWPNVGKSDVFWLISARSDWFGMMLAIAVPAHARISRVGEKGQMQNMCNSFA